jgi:hypothetical protein
VRPVSAGNGMLTLFQPSKGPQISDSRRTDSTKAGPNKREETIPNSNIWNLMLTMFLSFSLVETRIFKLGFVSTPCFLPTAAAINHSNNRDIKDKLTRVDFKIL